MSSATRTSSKRGVTLLETLLYGAGLIVILGGIVAFIFYLYGWYRNSTVPTRIDNIGISLLHRIGTDIRAANSIESPGTDFNVQIGALKVKSALGTVSTTTRYSLQSGRIRYELNGGPSAIISPTDIWVSGLYFNELSTSTAKAVRIRITLDYRIDGATTTSSYAALAILRQSYD